MLNILRKYFHVACLIANKKGLGSVQKYILKIRERKGLFDSLGSQKSRWYLIHINGSRYNFPKLTREKEERINDIKLVSGEKNRKMK